MVYLTMSTIVRDFFSKPKRNFFKNHDSRYKKNKNNYNSNISKVIGGERNKKYKTKFKTRKNKLEFLNHLEF